MFSLRSLFVADAQTEGGAEQKYIYALVIFHPPPALDSGFFFQLTPFSAMDGGVSALL
jgi:hypothetical protein